MKYYADTANLHARIHAMRSRLIPPNEYAAVISRQESAYDTASGPPGMIKAQEAIFSEQIAAVMTIAEAIQRYAPLFIAFLCLYEAENVKGILSKVFGMRSFELWYDIGPFAAIDKDFLTRDVSLNDVRAELSGTYLEGIFEGEEIYESLETRLDVCALRNLYAASASLLPDDGKILQDFVLRRVAVLTVVRQWRLSVSYGWSYERTEVYRDEISALFGGIAWPQLKTVEELLSRRLEEWGKGGESTPDPADVESYLDDYYYGWASSMFHRDFHSIYCVAAYLWLLACQIRNLFRVVEGVRFGLPHDEILRKIISYG